MKVATKNIIYLTFAISADGTYDSFESPESARSRRCRLFAPKPTFLMASRTALLLIGFALTGDVFARSASAQLVWKLVPAPGARRSPQAAQVPIGGTPGTQASAHRRNTPVETARPSFGSSVSLNIDATSGMPQVRSSPGTPPLPLSQTAPSAVPPTLSIAAGSSTGELRQNLLIPPLVRREKPWPAPSLSPGVPSGFIAKWGDAFIGASAATAGNQRGGQVDGSWVAGFGLGDAAKLMAIELSGGCGSTNNFCANGSIDAKISRLIVNQSTSRLAVAAAWQNLYQWGNEGPQDNTYYAVASYALPLRTGGRFGQTLQFNLGVGNSRYAPYTEANSQNNWGVFGSIGVELTPYAGLAAGWSGRGLNAQLSITPLRDLPISINLLGVDLLDQNPAGTVGVLSVSWGSNFRTARFD